MSSNHVLLETIQLTSSAASVTFDNIPQSGYTDLKVVVSARSNQTDFAVTDVYAYFNGVNTNQTQRNLRGYGGSSGTVTSQTRTDVLVGNMPSAVNTTNTFSNAEMYIPNYTASTSKSISIDAVSESNNTGTGFDWWVNLGANLWSSNSAITAITLIPSGGSSFVANSTFSLYGLAAVGTTPGSAPFASGGNIVDTDGTYWYHTFLTSGTFTPLKALTCDYLVVAGGGAGGPGYYGGGGGAGGLRSTVTGTGGGGSLETPLSLTSGATYTVTVGAGGVGGWSDFSFRGYAGSDSTFATITSTGGGGGGTFNTAGQMTGGNGGSGGGGGTVSAGGTGTTNQGYGGGTASSVTDNRVAGGGGGGAGGVGGNPSGSSGTGIGGAGGAGVATSISGSSVTYGGGGGGGYGRDSGVAGGNPGPGGAGGGGNGSTNGNDGISGTANRGGGGGGAGGYPRSNGSGGSGIVIVRYAIA
jgi:hypothetical protein